MNQKNKYWEKRALLIENESYNNIIYHLQKIKEQYEEAEKNINSEIAKFYKDFAINNKITLADAKRILNNSELKEFKTSLSQYKKMVENSNNIDDELLEKIKNISIKKRISRLQSLEEKINIILDQANSTIVTEINDDLFETLENSYYKNLYNFENQNNLHIDFSMLNTKLVDDILTYSWSGVTYSDRIWRNQSELKQKLIDALNRNFIQGNSINQLSAEMSKALNTSYKNCTRLLRTEVSYINNRAAIESYKEKNIKEYEFTAVLDLRTSEICAEMDGKIFSIEEMTVGVNCPPLHPNCRSTIVPHIEGMERNRIARDPKTGDTEEVGNLTYKEWYEKYVENKYNKQEIENMRKKFLNYSSDKKQYERYKELLTSYSEKITFDNFQEIKYNNIETWQNIKSEYNLKKHYDKVIKNGELSPLIDFNTYKSMNNQIQKELIGLKTKNSIEIKSYSKHFVDRVCGSVEQKRSGVSIKDIKDTILNSKEYKELSKSIVLYGQNVQVSINPVTGNLIQTNPRIRGKK